MKDEAQRRQASNHRRRDRRRRRHCLNRARSRYHSRRRSRIILASAVAAPRLRIAPHSLNFGPNPAQPQLDAAILSAREAALATYDQSAVAEHSTTAQYRARRESGRHGASDRRQHQRNAAQRNRDADDDGTGDRGGRSRRATLGDYDARTGRFAIRKRTTNASTGKLLGQHFGGCCVLSPFLGL